MEVHLRDRRDFLAFANDLADVARDLLAESDVTEGSLDLRQKPDGLVTKYDLLLEERLRAEIKRRFPTHGILGEELSDYRTEQEFCWVLDPIDGTDDFVRRIPLFGSIIALAYRGRPLVGVIEHPWLGVRCAAAIGVGAWHNNERIQALRAGGLRTRPAVALPAYEDLHKLSELQSVLPALLEAFPNSRTFRNVYGHTLTVTGKLAACLEVCVSPWDVLATEVLAEEAGLAYSVVHASGTEARNRRLTVAFGNQVVVAEMEAVLSRQAVATETGQ
jgi:fructose-1,6-bisphosphatase/inositol monophosphatase family enzyme